MWDPLNSSDVIPNELQEGFKPAPPPFDRAQGMLSRYDSEEGNDLFNERESNSGIENRTARIFPDNLKTIE
jgi:hypothetical protein